MKVLLTGANGFVGINILNEIVTNNTTWELTCLINKNEDNIPKHIRKIYDLNIDTSFDVIIHAGANSSSKSCIETPISALNDNIITTFNILEFARKTKCIKIIFLSGCEVYGYATNKSCENDMLISRNMYGASKIACEHMCSAYYHSYGISSVAIRLLNTYGPHCQPERFPSIIQQKFESDAIPHFILTSKSTKRWLDIQVMAKRIIFIIQNITIGFDIFNFVGNEDLNLIEFIRKISNDRPFTYEYKIDALSGYNPDYNADGTKFMDFYNKIINKIPNDY